MKQSQLLFLVLAFVFSTNSCNETPDYLTRLPIFTVLGPDGTETSEISITGKSQTVSFTVIASDEWTAEVSDADAFTLVDKTGGGGNNHHQPQRLIKRERS